jgi:hypothetical protein
MASLDKLHNNLKNEYDLPDLETFKKDMSNPTNLRKFYDTLKKDGYDLPDFDTFSKEMFPSTTKYKFLPQDLNERMLHLSISDAISSCTIANSLDCIELHLLLDDSFY